MSPIIPPFMPLHPDMLRGLASPRPERAGLMSDEGAEEKPGFWDRLSRLWAGSPDPRLSQEQEKRIRQDSLTAMGLNMLMASSNPEYMPHIMQILAQGAAGGQQYAAGQREQTVQRDRRARLAAAVQDGQVDDAMLDQLFAESLAQGDIDSARVLSEVIKSRRSAQAQGIKTVQTDNEIIVMDAMGQEIRRYPRQQDLERVDVGDAIVWYDRAGNEVRRTAKRPAPGMENQRDQSQSNQLMGRYLSQTSDDRKVADLYGTVLAASKDPTAAGDLSMIFAYMKVLDPGSVVREGEFANAQNTGSIPNRVWAMYNRILRGERLTSVQRQDFLNQATAIARQRSDKLQQVIAWYREIAERRGLNPEDVAYNYYEIFFPQASGAAPGVGSGAPAPGAGGGPQGEGAGVIGDDPLDRYIHGGG